MLLYCGAPLRVLDPTLAPCPAESDFTCSDMTCIPLSKYCDGHSDCPDSEDELFCSYGNK